ncbi:MAG: endonuclease/exonuclease/phosphatase family protein [Candidatus Accumulibacter sp.]|jgi:endonuclease/exonuclease/phosphatase family metal-dependent hydrolase|nr:endonuclease/exonuclease/phosphatase family protein [Accumulibacter sp.]
MLRIVTCNIHKGFSQFNRHMSVYDLREELRASKADIVLLQEVQGKNRKHARNIENWPTKAQHRFLAEDVWLSAAYGCNTVYRNGHHGNAILSRYPILGAYNQDVTHYRFERRGILHCTIAVDGLRAPLHCVSVHLSLFARSRRLQIGALADYLENSVAPASPMIVAGDFNDWRNEAERLLAERLGLNEAFSAGVGHPGRSFPAALPVLRLDRIYVRGFSVADAEIHSGRPWARISDHAALSADLSWAESRTSLGAERLAA